MESEGIMQLAFIWTEDFGYISKQGFNFDGNFEFLYNPDLKILHIKENENYIDDFFDDTKKISDVTGIVGENGAGKTTVLNLIKNIFSQGGIFTNQKYIIAFTKKQNNTKKIYVFYHDSLLKKIEDLCFKDSVEIIKDSYNLEKDNFGHIKRLELPTVPCIFFSNVFDTGLEQSVLLQFEKQLFNVSTNYLMKTDKHNWNFDEDLDMVDAIDLHRASNVFRQAKFISESKFNKLGFRYPDALVFGYPLIEIFENKSGIPEEFRNILNQLIGKNEKHENEKKRNLSKFLYNMINSYFNQFPDDLDFEGEFIEPMSLKQKKGYFQKDSIDGIIKVLKDWKHVLKEYRYRPFDSEYMDGGLSEEWLLEVQSLVNLINLLVNEENIYIYHNQLCLKLGEGYDVLKKFMKDYIISSGMHPYITLNWNLQLSSGQKAMLDTFSRFYSVAIEINNLADKNILILIDEGELYFHPQWQKSLLKDLLDFFKTIYHKDIQVILTSNSPFIVSDLPKHNIVFIGKKAGGNSMIDALVNKKQTFAANIHTLLSDSFFLEGELIGDFAKEKINWLINILSGDIENIRRNEKKIRKLINLIGEPIIKNKLMSMLEDQLKINLIHVDNEIDNLKKRIMQLENILLLGDLDD
ncbi:AAA family ATPase [Bacillus sp. FSL K6-1218]|uniref:AAA family ATPase n=2 Tax=unclassified Bacillus (in: firmicutes) TaxID=185979 RepID=UPI0030F53017